MSLVTQLTALATRIANEFKAVRTEMSQLGGGAPDPHAATHAAGGSDPVTLAQSQVTNLTTDLAGKANLTGATFTGNINMSNANIDNINALTFNDPGPNEGITWLGGNLWRIYESPNDLTTNSSGNLQFVTGGTRRATLDTSGNLDVTGNLTAAAATFSNTVDANNGITVEAATKDNITTRTEGGFFQTSTATTGEGWPVTSNGWYHLIASTHSNTGNYYSLQIAADFFNNNDIFNRSTNGNGATGWSRIYNSSNIHSTIVSPTSAGSAGVRKTTISTSNPSGGADGDVWLKYS